MKVSGTITDLKGGGRSVLYEAGGKKGKLGISGSRTKLSVGGATAKRKQLKKGMSCEFVYVGSEAKSISCN
jgi:hypothetical protein